MQENLDDGKWIHPHARLWLGAPHRREELLGLTLTWLPEHLDHPAWHTVLERTWTGAGDRRDELVPPAVEWLAAHVDQGDWLGHFARLWHHGVERTAVLRLAVDRLLQHPEDPKWVAVLGPLVREEPDGLVDAVIARYTAGPEHSGWDRLVPAVWKDVPGRHGDLVPLAADWLVRAPGHERWTIVFPGVWPGPVERRAELA